MSRPCEYQSVDRGGKKGYNRRVYTPEMARFSRFNDKEIKKWVNLSKDMWAINTG